MPPKFQSSFIPKGPVTTSSGSNPTAVPVRRGDRSIIAFVGNTIFTLAIILAGSVFAYKYYLNRSIAQMGSQLESARATLEPELIKQLTDLNERIVSTQAILHEHTILTPVFLFLEEITPTTVRYTQFKFDATEAGSELRLLGQATSYAALAGLSELINQNPDFKQPLFSDLKLDDKGNVSFSLVVTINPQMLSYEKMVSEFGFTPIQLESTETASTTPLN